MTNENDVTRSTLSDRSRRVWTTPAIADRGSVATLVQSAKLSGGEDSANKRLVNAPPPPGQG